MGDKTHENPQTTVLGSLNYVFQEPDKEQNRDNEKNPDTLCDIHPPSTSSNNVSIVFPSTQDNLLLRQQIIQKYSSCSDTDPILDVEQHAKSVNRKRAKRKTQIFQGKHKLGLHFATLEITIYSVLYFNISICLKLI